jgi:hypothetical protein
MTEEYSELIPTAAKQTLQTKKYIVLKKSVAAPSSNQYGTIYMITEYLLIC